MPVPTPRRPRPARRQSPPLWPFALLALAVHAALICLWAQAPLGTPAPPKRPKATALTLPAGGHAQAVSQARDALQRAQRPQTRDAHPPPPPKEPPKPLRGTVVDLPPSAHDPLPPKDSAYLAEHNARAAKETRSRHATLDPKNVMNELTRARRGDVSQRQPPPKGRKGDGATGKSQRAPAVAQQFPEEHRDRVQLPENVATGTVRNQQPKQASADKRMQLRRGPAPSAVARDGDAQFAARGQGGSPGGTPLSMAQLIPSLGALAQLEGGPKNDVGRDVEEGDGTFLNAREFKYASFFNRLKDQIANFWRPLPEYARRDPTGNIYGLQNRLTVLSITLDAEGALHDLKLVQSSGIAFLDDAGLEAVRTAAPFAHPPRGLLDPNNHIVFNFAFSVDVTGRYMGGP